MSKTYITSDLHLSHKNIIKYSPWARGHYRSIDEMNESIITNINSVVTDQDTLIIVGDICFGDHDQTTDFLKRMNGFKKLVWGNHDKKYRDSTQFRIQKSLMGVVWDGDYLEFDHKFEDRKYKIVVNHFPFLTWNRKRYGSFNFFGHCHSQFPIWNGRQRDIGMDSSGMMPNLIDDLIAHRLYEEAHDPSCIQLEDHHK